MPQQQHRASIFELVLWALEDVSGTQVPALRLLQSLTMDAEPQLPSEMVEAAGFKTPVDIILSKEWTKASLKGKLSFNDILYPLSSGLCTPTVSALTTNGIYTVTITSATGGTFTLTFNGQTTAPIAYNATAATVQAALAALSTVFASSVTVTGAAGGPFTVSLVGLLATTQLPLTGNGASLTGGTLGITTTVPTLSKLWRFFPNVTGPDILSTFSVEKGSTAGAGAFAYGSVTDFSIDFAVKSAEVKGEMIGQAYQDGFTLSKNTSGIFTLALGSPTAGTFSLTFGGNTAATIPYNVTAAVLQTTLAALASVGAGNVAVNGGGGGVYTIAFIGSLAGTASALTGTGAGLTGGAFAITTGATVVPIRAVSPKTLDVFVGDSLTTLNHLSEAFKAMWEFKGRLKPVETLDSTVPSFSYTIEDKMGFKGQLVMEQDAVANGFMANLRAAKTKFARITMRGAQIETGVNYLIQITFPFKFREPKRGDNEGVYAGTYDLEPIYDAGFAGAVEVIVITDYQTL